MPSQLEMLERWTKFARRRCQFETREREREGDSGTRERRRRSEEERESEGEEVKMKQMKAEELGVLVRWTTETRRRCQWEAQETACEKKARRANWRC